MSNPNWSRPLALAVTLTLLAGGAVWLEYKHKPEKEAQEGELKKFFNLKGKPVEYVRLFDGARTFVVSCLDLEKGLCKVEDQSHWELNIPTHLKADNSNVSSLLSALNNFQVTETIDLSSETPEKRTQLLKEYKLDSSQRKPDGARQVEIKFKGGETQTLYFGDTHPMGESIFALKNSDETKVYLAPTYFKSNFEKNVSYWRDKRLFTTSAGDFTGFELITPKETIRAEKKDGKWILKTKEGDLAGDIENIDNLLTAVSYLSAKEVTEEDKKEAKAKKLIASAKKALTYKLKIKGKTDKEPDETVVLEFYTTAKPEKLYAVVSNLDALFELEMTSKDRVTKYIGDLRLAKLITSMERFTVNRIELASDAYGASHAVFDHKDTKWIRESDKKEMNADTVQVFLDRISGNKIKEFIPPSKAPAGSEKGLTVILGDEKDAKKRQILFWKTGDKLYARDVAQKKGEALLIDSTVTEALPWEKTSFEGASKAPKIALPKPPGHDHDHDEQL